MLSVYSPVNCMQHAGKLTSIEVAMNAPAPTLGTIQREKSRDFTIGLVMGWLVYLNDILNLNKPMTEDQIELCAIEVTDEYYSLKMSDLAFLFRKIIAGHYGEFYESLTISKMLTFFRDYFDERCQYAEQQAMRQHADFSGQDEFNYSRNFQRIWTAKSRKS
ncbi:hypothetical protein [Flavobacterium sp. NRK1]|uniref:hypothetical protein n=1 Tax=Flavobacterium sp. NRK1 TaxID=2954929 RepID=UPI0020932E63|nr:hypothetical protein [Flavobacterium sp. NRK1]